MLKTAEPGVHLGPLEFLRRQTRELHAELETSTDITAWLASIPKYRELLVRYLSVYRPFEKALLSRCDDFAEIAPWSYVSRVVLLERDLAALGAEPALESDLGSALPNLKLKDSVLGALYVVEGSSLGGQLIYRAIEQRLGLNSDSGAAFFLGAGTLTGAAWKQFTTMLEVQISQPEQAARAACAMFQGFQKALQSNMEIPHQ